MAEARSLTVTSKNLIPYCILRVLQDHSDFSHKLTQGEIMHYLKTEYGIDEVERKSVGRNIAHLRDEMDIAIESDSKGTWLDEKQFEDYELQVLIDGVMGSRYISKKYSKALIDKLTSLGNDYFKSHVNYTFNLDGLGKTENKSVFYNIGFIELAVSKKCRLTFDYNRYGVDNALHTTEHHEVTPYRMVVHNQRYYLMALNEKYGDVVYYRIDHITNMNVIREKHATPIRRVPGWEGGITNEKLVASLPFMFSDKQCMITLDVESGAIDHMIDCLGFDMEISEAREENGKVRLTVKSCPSAMKSFALQYLDLVEVIAPESLRKDIADNLRQASASIVDKEENEMAEIKDFYGRILYRVENGCIKDFYGRILYTIKGDRLCAFDGSTLYWFKGNRICNFSLQTLYTVEDDCVKNFSGQILVWLRGDDICDFNGSIMYKVSGYLSGTDLMAMLTVLLEE